MYGKPHGVSPMGMAAHLSRWAHVYLTYIGLSMLLLSAYILTAPMEGFGVTHKLPAPLHPTTSQQSSSQEATSDRLPNGHDAQKLLEPREQAANATLGFQKLLVLSTKPSWRTRGLQAAAKLTGLEFTFPPQPPNGKETVEGFMAMSPAGNKTRPALGSAAAWLAHIDLLKYIVASDLETAFIVEDDVDWDVRIKNQMRLISDNVRAFRDMKVNVTDPMLEAEREKAREAKKAEEEANAAKKTTSKLKGAAKDKLALTQRNINTSSRTYMNDDNGDTTDAKPNRLFDNTPYGVDWDVLWLGHCGSIGRDDATHRRPMTYSDPTRVSDAQYSGWAMRYFLDAHLPPDHRVVQESRMTVCTFGYAVSRRGARNVLGHVMRGGYEAFDVALNVHCSEGRLKCVMVSPTVFHHYEPSAAHGYVSQVKEGDGKGVSKSESDFERFMGSTANIVESARCHALWDKGCLREP